MTTKVLLVDDHRIIADGLSIFINKIKNFKVVGWANTGQAALNMYKDLQPDIILLEYRLPDKNGLEMISELLALNPELKIIILTSYANADAAVKAINAGAKGYLTKNIDEKNLQHILTSVMEGNNIWLDPSFTGSFMQAVQEEYNKIDTSLTEDEKSLISLIAQGKSNKEIAEQFYVSDQTVKNHLSRIYKKVGFRNRTEVARYAIEHRIV